jgi:AcrR family transcriptional regulator
MNHSTQNRILEATKQLLEQGHGASLRMVDIAQAANISRQALYLHFTNRTDLLVATARYVDDSMSIDTRLAASRSAKSGIERLNAFVEFWGLYLPEIYAVVKTIMQARHSDLAAQAAWLDRMSALRSGCRAIVDVLIHEKLLAENLTPKIATDLLWSSLSVSNWEQLTVDCKWSNKQYIERMQAQLARSLVREGSKE